MKLAFAFFYQEMSLTMEDDRLRNVIASRGVSDPKFTGWSETEAFM